MLDLTPEGRQRVAEIAGRHGVGFEAAQVLLRALVAGQGSQAQFSHPDLGGMGQWSRGGMIMVGDMFNHGLKQRVDALCNELSGLLAGQSPFATAQAQSSSQSQAGPAVSLFVPGGQGGGNWWPAELGQPATSGAQNDLAYAWFARPRRLAIRRGGAVQVYDTGDHAISGVSQQQSGDQSLTFTSQTGLVRLDDLPKVAQDHGHAEAALERPEQPKPILSPKPILAPKPILSPDPVQKPEPAAAPAHQTTSMDAIFDAIERLAGLREKHILTEEEFAAKKAELLARL